MTGGGVDNLIAGMLDIEPPKARTTAEEPPAGMFDDWDAATVGAEAIGGEAAASNVVDIKDAPKRKTPLERQAEADRARIVWGDALEGEPAPIPWVCEGFAVAPGRPSVIVGEGGTRKSFLAQYLQLCVATGSKFFGRHDVVHGKALFMDYEAGLFLAKKRLQRWARGVGFRLRDHRETLAYIERPFYLDDIERGAERLAELVRGFTLCIVDSCFRSAPRLKQNDAEAAVPLEIMTRASNWTSCTFVAVDHASTKREEGGRRKSMQSGNHHKLDGAGTVYALTAEKHEGRFLPTLVTCEREQLEQNILDDFAFDMVDVPDPAAQPPYNRAEMKWGLRVQEYGPEAAKPPAKGKAAEGEAEPALYQIGLRIVEEVKKQPGVSSGELLERLKIHKGRFGEAMNVLQRDGKISNRTGKATRTEWVAT